MKKTYGQICGSGLKPMCGSIYGQMYGLIYGSIYGQMHGQICGPHLDMHLYLSVHLKRRGLRGNQDGEAVGRWHTAAVAYCRLRAPAADQCLKKKSAHTDTGAKPEG
jgi:hypothetical protein